MAEDGVLPGEQCIAPLAVVVIEIAIAFEGNREVSAELPAVAVSGTVDNHRGQGMPERTEALPVSSLHPKPGFFFEAALTFQPLAPPIEFDIVVRGKVSLNQESRICSFGNIGIPRPQQVQG